MGLNILTLRASKKYTEQTIIGEGAIKGKDGADGKSAYEVAKANGFEGTETEWLESLKGKTGNKGDKGLSSYEVWLSEGNVGTEDDFLLSLKGHKGDKGEQGVIGEKGEQGEQGIQGKQGVKGDKGDDGYPFLIYKEYHELSEFNSEDFPEIGLMFIIKNETTETYPVYRYTGDTENPYSYITELSTSESIKGEKGDKGDTGEQGVQGVAGKDGTTYTPTIGKINTVDNSEPASASVEIDEDKKVAKFNFDIPKGKDGTGSGSNIDVDTEMSDTSENAVQNKVIKKYVDEKSVNISADDNNAIKSNEDGIYVKDLSDDISRINIAQKTVNKELDYVFLQVPETIIDLKQGSVIPFSIKVEGTVETVKDNYSFKLKAGKRYKISCDLMADSSGTCTITLRDVQTNDKIGGFVKAASNYTTSNSDCSFQCVYTPKADCELQFFVSNLGGQCRLYNKFNSAYLIVEEMAMEKTIDPLEYVNESQGIEDTPVGHIIAHMGTIAPKHYLVCDGSEYNISDYPYLAQHIKDNFGSINYFGGDGINTFSVVDLRGEFLRGTGTNSHTEQGNGGTVGEHQDATQHMRFVYSNNGLYTYTNSTTSSPQNEDCVSNNMVAGKRASLSASGNSNEYYTSRPTNTSVLYCIKYEPTYFMQNTYNGNVYSADEQIVGKWIDGKTIYQKTISYDTLTPTTKWTKLHEIQNVDSVISIKHLYGVGNGDYYQSTDGIVWNDDTTRLQIAYHDGAISYVLGSAFTGDTLIKSIHITMQYTKTTDSPSDVPIAPNSSCSCVNYTDEEVSTEIDTVLGGTE